MRSIPKVSAAIISSIALVATGLLGAGPASAAPGDVTEIGLAAGATPRDVAKGPDNNMWVTGGASKTIAKVTPEGAVTAYALPLPDNVGNPWGIAAGPDGNMWFTLRDGGKLGRITMAGAVSIIDLPDPAMRPQDITAGPDGNMWFTELGGRIGRVTMAGAVSMFNVPWANSTPHSIVQGPEGSSRLYFTDAGADRIAYVLVDGTTYGSVPLATASDPTGIANVDGAIWFAMTARSQLGKLVADTTVLEMAVPGAPSNMTSGVGNTMWVSLSARNSVAKYSAQGPRWANTPSPARTRYPRAWPKDRRRTSGWRKPRPERSPGCSPVRCRSLRRRRASIPIAGSARVSRSPLRMVRGTSLRAVSCISGRRAVTALMPTPARTSPAPLPRPMYPRPRTPISTFE